jgi:hypothetical protein
MEVTYSILSKFLCLPKRSDYFTCALSFTIKSEMSPKVPLAHENWKYKEICSENTIDWISVTHFFSKRKSF